ncbi:MAG: hypothetical protein V4850_33750 [Myxococcota bacterium]
MNEVSATLDKGPTLPAQLTEQLRQLAAFEGSLSHAGSIIAAREAAFQALTGLEATIEGGNQVPFFGVSIPFHQARFLLLQAYVSSYWSLADLVTAVAGRFLCLESVGKNDAHPPKLWEHFVRDTKCIPSDFSALLRHSYGLPVAVSYALRNHFVHDGAQNNGTSFFTSNGAANFEISDPGWLFLERKVFNEYGVTQARTLAPEPWPWPKDDVRKVLAICGREVDAALGIVIRQAAVGFRLQVGHLLDGRQ